MTPELTLDETIRRLRDADRQIAELSALRAFLRAQLEQYVAEGGGALAVPGMRAQLYPPSLQHRYDLRQIDSVVLQLLATGDIDLMQWARQISAARQSTQRQAWLKITWEDA